MSFTLKLFDTELLRFDVLENLAEPVLQITWQNPDAEHLLPIDMQAGEEGLSRWLRHRTIPKNRAYVNSFLAKCGLSSNRPMDIIQTCHGLSLNDSYWVTEDSFLRNFQDCNLFENRFSQLLAWTAFTGYGSSIRSTFTSSPEFTTNGMLPKCWRRIDGKIYLYKGASSGYANAGCEPFSELYASMIGEQMGLSVIPYQIRQWKGNTCSVCELFTSADVSFVPVGRIIRTGGMKAVRDWYETLGQEFVDALDDMIVFDAIICNTDRHYGNFGVLLNSHTRKVIAPAPLFDHGCAVFNYAGDEFWASEEKLQQYIDTLTPVAYPDFMKEAKSVMNDRLRKKVRPLLNWKLRPRGKYNYSSERLQLLEKQVQTRARMLL